MVVLEKTASPKAGTYVELVGTYNPKTKAFNADGEKIKGWIGKGAQVSPSLMNLLIAKGILEGKKIAVVSKKNLEKNIKVEAPAEQTAPVAEAVVATPVEEKVADIVDTESVDVPAVEAQEAAEEVADTESVEVPIAEADVVEEAPAEVAEVKEEAPAV